MADIVHSSVGATNVTLSATGSLLAIPAAANLLILLDERDMIASDGKLVSWKNQVGTGELFAELSAPNAAKQVYHHAAYVNGLAAIERVHKTNTPPAIPSDIRPALVGDHGSAQTLTAVTVSMLIKATTTSFDYGPDVSDNWLAALCKDTPNTPNVYSRALLARHQGNGWTVRYYYGSAAGQNGWDDATLTTDIRDAWHLVTWVIDKVNPEAALQKLYIDGTLVSTFALSNPTPSLSARYFVLGRYDAASTGYGYTPTLMMWNKVLDSGEMAALLSYINYKYDLELG